MSLVIGFHRPTSGRILLDGRDMNGIDLRGYRSHLAVVSQQTILFEGTLRENIVYGLRDVDEARLRAAVEAANAAEFVAELPRGLETEIGERGARLSGGQRQRVAIARALLRRSARAHSRRGDERVGRGERGRGAGGTRPADGRPHDVHRRASAAYAAQGHAHRGTRAGRLVERGSPGEALAGL